ncbi:MAG: hypothetical protein Athens071416_447 [Parcubacteria group bacterium Athens0714_16]|nr:MAG: hypothetical protein Athens071416_447 [Parcubacteria group bacterium Athens0714_16]
MGYEAMTFSFSFLESEKEKNKIDKIIKHIDIVKEIMKIQSEKSFLIKSTTTNLPIINVPPNFPISSNDVRLMLPNISPKLNKIKEKRAKNIFFI